MTIRTFLLVIAMVAIAAFVALNWGVIMTPTTLTLGVGSVQAPLGFIMLGLLTLFTGLFFVFVIYSKTSGFFKERHHVREMKATQELADSAETSRFTELREFLRVELKKQGDLFEESVTNVLKRLDQFDDALRSAIKEPGHTFTSPVESTQLRKEKA